MTGAEVIREIMGMFALLNNVLCSPSTGMIIPFVPITFL